MLACVYVEVALLAICAAALARPADVPVTPPTELSIPPRRRLARLIERPARVAGLSRRAL